MRLFGVMVIVAAAQWTAVPAAQAQSVTEISGKRIAVAATREYPVSSLPGQSGRLLWVFLAKVKPKSVITIEAMVSIDYPCGNCSCTVSIQPEVLVFNKSAGTWTHQALVNLNHSQWSSARYSTGEGVGQVVGRWWFDVDTNVDGRESYAFYKALGSSVGVDLKIAAESCPSDGLVYANLTVRMEKK